MGTMRIFIIIGMIGYLVLDITSCIMLNKIYESLNKYNDKKVFDTIKGTKRMIHIFLAIAVAIGMTSLIISYI